MNTLSTTAATPTPGTWVIDGAHSVVAFAARHLMSRVRGTFDKVTGKIVAAKDPLRSSVTATIETASVSTGVPMRDDHVRSADFFDAQRWPTMTFVSTGLRANNTDWTLTGNLMIKGVTRSVDLHLQYLGVDPTGLQGEPRIGFTATTTVSRRDFGITWGLDATKLVVGDTVDITLDVEAYQAE